MAGRRAAKRAAKIAVLNMLEDCAAEFMGAARHALQPEQHDELVEAALANNELKDQLARQWGLTRVEGV